MSRSVLRFITAAALLTTAAPAFAQPPGPQFHDCDRLAASPSARDRKADGVALDKIDVTKAIASCRAALRDFPNTTRFQFQLARALDRSRANEKEAFDLYLRAAQAGHLGAMNALGVMYGTGRGVTKDEA